jgi:hypothetical protein
MKRSDPFTNAYLVKIGKEGLLTLSIPEMADRYLIVEQRNGHLTITPFDVDWEAGPGVIARREGNWTLLGNPGSEIPRV